MKTRGAIRCSGRVSISRSACGTNSLKSEPDWIAFRPEHLKHLYANNVKYLDPCDNRKVLVMLHRYQDVFAASSSYIGRTSIIKHEIHSKPIAPVSQKPHRLSFTKRAIADRMIDNMLERNIIEPSNSPWATLFVLVTKKDGSIRFCVDYCH